MSELFHRFFAHPLLFLQVLVCTILVNLLALGTAVYSIQVLNRFVAHGVTATLVALTIGVLIVVLFEFLFRLIRQRMSMGLTAGADAAQSERFFHLSTVIKAQALVGLGIDQKREAVQGPDAIRQAYSASSLTAFLDAPFSALFVLVLMFLHPVLGMIVLAAVLAAIALGVVQQMIMRRHAETGRLFSAARDALGTSMFSRTETVRVFSARDLVHRLWRDRAGPAAKARQGIEAWQGRGQAIQQAITALMMVGVTASGAVLVVEGALSVGALIGANLLAGRAIGPIARVMQISEPVMRARRGKAVLRTLETLPQHRTDGAVISPYAGGLEFKDVGFMYPGATSPLFEGLSLSVSAGDVVAVIGANGTGKTTLARILTGLIDPSRGSILVDGVELRQINPDWWHRQIMYLPQEPTFIDATIRDNILAVQPSLTAEQLGQLMRAVDLTDFLAQQKDGVGMVLQEGGMTLPVGIRRRLALARAIAGGGPVAVLDEPTEGLDAQGAAAVYGLMNRMHRDKKTIVVFSHDPNILKGAQWLIDLNRKPRPRIAQAVEVSDSLSADTATMPGL